MEFDGTDITDVNLGDTYRDTISGFRGKCVGRADYITGCAQAMLSALVQGKVESVWFDYPRLSLVETEERLALAGESKVRRSGGPTPVGQAARPVPR